MAKMCQVSEVEKLQSLPIMLKGESLSYVYNNMENCNTYTEAIQLFRLFYNSDEKRAQILTAWKLMTLSKAIEGTPDQYEVEVFRKFMSKLITLHKKLDKTYNTYARHFAIRSIYPFHPDNSTRPHAAHKPTGSKPNR